MIQVEHLSKRYGDRPALRDLSFTVEEGEIVALLGPNGAGKTTTLRILAGTLSASDGRVTIGGRDALEDSLEVRRRIGYLPEHPPLYDVLSVRDCLEFGAELKGIARTGRRSEIDRVAEATGLTAVLRRPAGQLSRGFRQRAGLAMALIGDPPVLVLDEPTIGLDPLQIREMRTLVRALAGRHTVLLSTHILSEAALTCSRALVLSHGRRVAMASLEELLAAGAVGSAEAIEQASALERVYGELVGSGSAATEG